VQGAGYSESKVKTDTTALELEMNAVALKLEIDAAALDLEMDRHASRNIKAGEVFG
jgi:hypothetical protein